MYRSYNILVGVYRFIRGLILFIRSLPRVFWRILKAYGRLCILIGRFFKKFFLLVHSEIRLLCAVDSLFGVIAGYLISRAYSLPLLAGVLAGMAAGAIIGLIQYQVFSVWILKLRLKNGEN